MKKIRYILSLLTLVIVTLSAAAVNPTKTIPVITINTHAHQPIVDKVTPVPATMHIDVPEGYVTLNGKQAEEAVGLTLTIRGRGNASWRMDKKPYKLKLDSKASLLGLSKSKHYALIPYAVNLISYGCVAGMELARCTGQSWAPYSEPVEVVLNNEYIGRYFLVESVKIDKNRLNIAEQPDLNEDPETVGDGWLVEIDNTTNDEQIVINEVPSKKLYVTYHTPEVLSDLQKQWLTKQFVDMNAAIYSGDATGEKWAALIDPASVARYFIVREVLSDIDGYTGSFYFHKDAGKEAKWICGPMWDLSLDTKNSWIFDGYTYGPVHWIEEMFYTDVFMANLLEQWENIKTRMPQVYDYIDRLGELTVEADKANYERWPQYESASSTERANRSKQVIQNNVDWMDDEINYITSVDVAIRPDEAPVISLSGNKCKVGYVQGTVTLDVFNLSGGCIASLECRGGDTVDLSTFGKGLFIVRASGTTFRPITLKTANWAHN